MTMFDKSVVYEPHDIIDQRPTSVKYLDKAAEIQVRKSQDYQNPNSTVQQADHYPRGVWTIYDMVHQKLIRVKSLLEAMESLPESHQTFTPKFESVEDSVVDAINYLSFLATYLNKEMDGQSDSRDIFNRKIK